MLLNFLIAFGIIFLLQIIFFAYAAWKKTDKVTDLSYGLTFIVSSITTYLLNSQNGSFLRILLVLVVCLWGARLSGYLFARILKTGKDKRFDGIRENVKKFTGFWVLQAISIFVILLPVTYVLLSDTVLEFNTITLVGLIISLFGILIEGIADWQKFVFKNNVENKGKWIQNGLWKYSRHPNYLGEIMMWVGVFIYSIFFLNGLSLITIISPIYITYLLIGVSGIPTLEREYEKKYSENKDYQLYKTKTGVLLPKIVI